MIPGCCSALATAERSTFSTVREAPSGENCSRRRASRTWAPRMRSTTRRAFRGEIRTYLADAFASMSNALLERRAPFRVMPVRPEHASRGELPQLVADHRLGDEHRHVLAAVVHGDRVPDHLRDDRGAAGPGADDPVVAAAGHLLDPPHAGPGDE